MYTHIHIHTHTTYVCLTCITSGPISPCPAHLISHVSNLHTHMHTYIDIHTHIYIHTFSKTTRLSDVHHVWADLSMPCTPHFTRIEPPRTHSYIHRYTHIHTNTHNTYVCLTCITSGPISPCPAHLISHVSNLHTPLSTYTTLSCWLMSVICAYACMYVCMYVCVCVYYSIFTLHLHYVYNTL